VKAAPSVIESGHENNALEAEYSMHFTI